MTSTVETKNGTKEVPPNKYCSKCEQWKPTLENFGLYAETNDGFTRHCNDCEKRRKRQYDIATRLRAIDIYGSECAECGVPEYPGMALQFDHVDNGGGEHRRNEGIPTMLARIARTGERITYYINKKTEEQVPVELQLLCETCHDIKTEHDHPGFLERLYEQHRQRKVLANAHS